MKLVAENTDGTRWLQIETVDEAMRLQSLSCTAVGRFFIEDQRVADLSGAQMPAYYAMMNAEGDEETSFVVGRIRDSGDKKPVMGGLDSDIMFVGTRNGNPFPQHATQVAALGDVLGIALSESAYPYGHPAVQDEEPEEANEADSGPRMR